MYIKEEPYITECGRMYIGRGWVGRYSTLEESFARWYLTRSICHLHFQGVSPLCPKRRRLQRHSVRSNLKARRRKWTSRVVGSDYVDEGFVVVESFEPVFNHLRVQKREVVTLKKTTYMCDGMVWRCWLPWRKCPPLAFRRCVSKAREKSPQNCRKLFIDPVVD